MGVLRTNAVLTGRNADLATDNYVRCSRCEFTCNLDRDRKGFERPGAGTDYLTTEINYPRPYVGYEELMNYEEEYRFIVNHKEDLTYNGGILVVSAPISFGCPQCGNLMYDKEEL